MEAIKNLLTSRPIRQSSAAPAPYDGLPGRVLRDQFEAQTARLRETHKAQRPKNTAKAYEL